MECCPENFSCNIFLNAGVLTKIALAIASRNLREPWLKRSVIQKLEYFLALTHKKRHFIGFNSGNLCYVLMKNFNNISKLSFNFLYN